MEIAPSPIFLVGCPRSGTSVTKKVLRLHAGLASCGVEHPYILELHDRFGETLPSPTEALSLFAASSGSFGSDFVGSARTHFASRGGPIRLSDFCSALWHLAQPNHAGRPFLLQYSGDGLIHSERLLGLFPGARFVVLTRDPRANISSQLSSLRKGRTTNRSINLWKECRVAAETLFRQHPDRAIDVPYEGLVTETERWIRSITDFLNLEWDDALLAFDVPMAIRDVDRVVEHRRFTEFDPAMLDKWRSGLSDTQIALIERRCRIEMELLGYDREGRPLRASDLPFVLSDSLQWALAFARTRLGLSDSSQRRVWRLGLHRR